MRAKRGDIVVIEKQTSYVTTTDGYHEAIEYDVGIVTSITREGVVKAMRGRYGDSTPLDRILRVQRTFIVSQDAIDVEAAAQAAWANPWRHNGMPGMPFDSLKDVRETLSVHKLAAA